MFLSMLSKVLSSIHNIISKYTIMTLTLSNTSKLTWSFQVLSKIMTLLSTEGHAVTALNCPI
jgi:hypothetical protein